MDLKKLFIGLLVLVLLSTTTAGCELAIPEATDMGLVPRDANLIANIQVSKIINDQDLIDAYDKAEKELGRPQTVEEALNEVVENTGVDLRDFSEAIVFADVTTLEQAEYLGFIIKGTFDAKQFVGNIEEKTGEKFTASGYRDYELYVDEGEEFGI